MFKKHHTSSLYKKILSPLTVLGLFISVVFVYALGVWYDGYRVDNGITSKVVGGNGGAICKVVKNNNCNIGAGIFVPTKTNLEWQGTDGFINKKPSCVTINACTCTTNSDCGAIETCGPSSNTITPTFYNVTNVCVGSSQNGAYGYYGARIYNPGYAYNAINVTPTVTDVSSSYWANPSSTTAGAVNKHAVWINSDCAGGIDSLTAGAELTLSYVYNNTGAQRTIYIGAAGDNYFRIKFNGTKIVEVTDSAGGTHTQFKLFHLLPVTLKQGYNSFEVLGKGDGSTNDAVAFALYDNTSAQLQSATSDASLKTLFSSRDLVSTNSHITAASCPEGYYLDTSAGANSYVCRSTIGQCMTTAKCGSANGSGFLAAPTTNLCSVGTPSSVAGSQPWSWTCYDTDGGGRNASCVSCNMNTWTTRSACSAGCGGGTQTRTNQCGSTETQSCNTHSCCSYNPTGIYGGAEYWTSPSSTDQGGNMQRTCYDHTESSNVPSCNTMNASQAVRGRTFVYPGDYCFSFVNSKGWNYAACGTLYKPGTICEGDPCVTSMIKPSGSASNYTRLHPGAYVGTFDSLTKTCKNPLAKYGSTNTNVWTNGGFEWFGSTTKTSYGAVAAW